LFSRKQFQEKQYKEITSNYFKSEMTNLNIVELIENNPITRLSNVYQSRLLNKITRNFNTDEQKLFVASFYSYLNFDSKTELVIDLDNVWEWLGFSKKHKAKMLLQNNFILNTDYKILVLRAEQKDSDKKQHGGHNKETFMLTINAFKRFCLKADTKKADKIHEYYIKLEETLHEVINEETNELKLQLEEVKNEFTAKQNQNLSIIENLKKEKNIEKHKILLREFATAGAMVYILRVKSYENGEYIIKIGESRRGIEGRFNEHKSNYEEAILLDCFLVKRSRDFEKFLHNHKDIRLNQVTTLQGHERERELFLVGKELSYGMILNVIKKNINQFNDIDYSTLFNELDSIKSMLSNQTTPMSQQNTSNQSTNDNIIQQLLDNQALLLDKITSLEKTNKEILQKLSASQTKITTGFEAPRPTLGPRLQKINPETLQLIKVYETVSECMREDSKNKRPSIEKAIRDNITYNGYRWAYVDRELDPNTITNLQPTKITKAQSLGYIAKLNASKTQILNVYLDRKTAAINNNYQSNSALDNPVKNGTITNGHFYMLYDKCENELKNAFSVQTPILYKDGVGQYDGQNNLLREFICKYDCIKSLQISDKTLAKALDKEVSYNGYYYRSLGSKLQCIS
jgi:phage anti-repressor protein